MYHWLRTTDRSAGVRVTALIDFRVLDFRIRPQPLECSATLACNGWVTVQ